MNLDALWQRNRRFALGFAGATLGFFVLLWLLTSGAASRQASAGRALAKAAQDLRAPMFGDAQEREARRTLETLRERNARYAAMALPTVRPEYRLPAGKAPAQYYIELTGALRQDLVAWALRNNCELDPSLGLPPVSPTQGPQIERVLRGLDVVERVARLAVQNGAARVDNVVIAERGRRAAGAKAALLDLTPVTLEVSFAGASPTPFLRAMLAEAAAGRPLGLAGVEVQEPNARTRERRILLEFAVGAMPQTGPEEAPAP